MSKLDKKSVKIMVMLMLQLINNSMSTDEFFEDVIFTQEV